MIAIVVTTLSLTAGFSVFWHLYWDSFVDPELAPYVEEFIEDAKKYGYPVDRDRIRHVSFRELPEVPYIGSLEMRPIAGFGLAPVVFIDVEYKGIGGRALKELVYHEIIHAAYLCPIHIDDEDPSIMNAGWVNWSEWDDLDYKVEKLFTKDLPKLGCGQ